MKKPKAVVAGHICLDITPLFSSSKQYAAINEYLRPGSMVLMKDADIHTGGAVSNTGLAMHLLGADVTLMAKTGNDPFGRLIEDIIKGHKASYCLASAASPTSYTIIIAPPGIDRIFMHNPGANNTYKSNDLDYEVIEEASLFHFGYPPVMKCMYENNGSELIGMFKKVKSLGLLTSLDMTAMDPDSEAAKADWNEILTDLLPYVDFFMPSYDELCFMLNRQRYYSLSEHCNPDIEQDLAPLASQLLTMGAAGVIIKCGAAGMYYHFAGAERLSPLSAAAGRDMNNFSSCSGFTNSFKPVKVLSATGAGDTAIAGFLTAFLKGETLDDCLEMAAAAGACCVEAYDALSGLPDYKAIKEKIRKGWEKL